MISSSCRGRGREAESGECSTDTRWGAQPGARDVSARHWPCIGLCAAVRAYVVDEDVGLGDGVDDDALPLTGRQTHRDELRVRKLPPRACKAHQAAHAC